MSYTSKDGINPYVMYDDLDFALIGAKLTENAGTCDYDWNENGVIFQPNGSIANENDRVISSRQLYHKINLNEPLYPHIHWRQSTTNNVVFTLQYRIQDNNATYNTTWTTMTARANGDSVFTYPGTGDFNQITKFNTATDGTGDYSIDISSLGISATIQIRLTRTDSTTGDVLGTFMDFHAGYDAHGSRFEYAK